MKLLLLLLTAAASLVHAEETLGRIGDIELKTGEIREALAGLEAGQETTLAKDPAALGQYVRALLVQRLVLQQAAQQKFDQDPAVIAKLVRARETALAEAYLQSFSTPPAGYPSAAELEATYETAKPGLLLPRAHRLAQIFLKDQAKAEDTARKLKAKDADFAATARTLSEDPASAAKGGEIGWLTEDQIQPAIREQLPKLSPGSHSAPIRLNDGWHLIKLLETREPATATLDQVRPQLTQQLRAQRAQQLRQDFIARLLKDHPPAINEIELGKLLPKTP